MANRQPEHELQSRCIKWFRYQYPHLRRLLFAVPNGGSRPKSEAARMKAEGVVPGVADIILLIPNYYYSSLNIEMKAESSQREEQKLYELCCKAAGSHYIICRSLDEFKQAVTGYLDSVNINILTQLHTLYKSEQDAAVEKAREQFRKIVKKQS